MLEYIKTDLRRRLLLGLGPIGVTLVTPGHGGLGYRLLRVRANAGLMQREEDGGGREKKKVREAGRASPA